MAKTNWVKAHVKWILIFIALVSPAWAVDPNTVAMPVFTPDGGTYDTAQNVIITCATPGATIRYTIDGSDPNNGTVIENGGSLSVTVDPPTTLKVQAFKSGWDPSGVKTAVYRSLGILYVNLSATGADNGTSWTDAYPSLQSALLAAVSGDEIWVAAGTYDAPSGGFQLKNNVAVYGGFAGSETDLSHRAWRDNPVILSGNNSIRVFYHPAALQLNSTAILDGVTIADGYAYYEEWWGPDPSIDAAKGGGMYNNSCSPTIRNCVFYNNTAAGLIKSSDDISLGWGGGISNTNSNPVIENCTFIQNYAVVGGDAIDNESSDPTITNCVFYYNCEHVICNNDSDPIIDNCTFAFNCNRSYLPTRGVSITNEYGSHPVIVNSILWDNSSIVNTSGSSCTVSYSDIRGGYSGIGNINLDPQFVSDPDLSVIPDWEALSLLPSSPCIDAGNNAAVSANITTDIMGELRFNDNMDTSDTGLGTPPIVDMGAHEIPNTIAILVFNPNGGMYDSGQTVTITCDTPGVTIRYTTDGSKPDNGIIIPNGGSITVAVDPPTTLRVVATKDGFLQSDAKATYWRYGGETGELNDPYLIYNKQQLLLTSTAPELWSKHFKLMADIDLTGEVFTAALIAPDINNFYYGVQGTAFEGVFDGNGHTLSNLTIAASTRDYLGLFGYIGSGGQVMNLGIINVNLIGRACVGGLVGANGGTLTSCYATGSVIGTDGSSYYIGGLAGNNGGTTSQCYATGSVCGDTDVGGLTGYNGGTTSQCYATGSVDGGSAVGGLVGVNGDDATVINCYSTGSVNGYEYVGGLAGWNNGSIIDCYSTDFANGSFCCGGLVGISLRGSTANSFWDTQTSGRTTSGGGTGKTTAEMKTLSTFTAAGWDFSDTDGDAADWSMPPGDYPKLSWKYSVGFNKFNLLSQYWQMSGCTASQPCAVADWYEDGTIDLIDLEILAEYWLSSFVEKQYPPMEIHWPMDEFAGSSTAADIISGHNGQLINMDLNTCWTAGNIGGALHFDGIDDYVQITGYKGILGSRVRTCAAWIKAVPTGQHQIVMSWGGPDPGQTCYWGGLFTAPDTTELAIGIGGSSYIKSSAAPFDNQWHHLAVVLPDDDLLTTGKIKLYIDGQLRTDTTIVNGDVAVNTSGTSDVYLGAYTGTSTPSLLFKGLMDDVRIYNTVLSDAQIEEIFQTE